MNELTEEALIDILVKPKNALTKQYKRLFEYEQVSLSFTDEALKEVANLALKRKTGARGLRAILEQAMLDIMYEIPSKAHVKECIIDKEVILNKKVPQLIFRTEEEIKASKEQVKTEAESA